jgi:peptide-methionine (R)-S-oxide reductase
MTLACLCCIILTYSQDTKLESKEIKTTIMDQSEYNKLNDFERFVILQKGTERPFTGKYVDHDETGVYVCRQCNAPLYNSESAELCTLEPP